MGAASTAARISVEIGAAFAGNFKSVFGAASSEVTKIGNEIKKLEDRQKELNSVIRQQEKLGKNGSALKALYSQQEIDQITQKLARLRKEQMALSSAHAGIAAGKSKMAGAGLALGAVVATAATAGIPIAQAASFEKAMLGVAKQVEGARDSSGNLTSVYHEMARQIQLLGREIPIATNEIADMVAAGARMGVARDELIGFTKTSAMMASAFDLPAGELADQMGKIAGLFKIPIPAIGNLADSINYLDDNAIAKGSDIIDFLTRTGGVAGSVKVTADQMAALGSTLLTLGERSETASTATSALFMKLASADKGTKKFRSAMGRLGLSLGKVQKGMQTDAQGTLLQVLQAISKLPAEKRLGALTDIVGIEHADTIAKLAANVGEYRKQIDMIESGKAKGSMGREFAAQLATTNAQWEITKNRIFEIGVNIGSVLLPAVNNLLGAFGSITSAVADFVRENRTLVGNLAAVAATVGVVFGAMKLGTMAVGAFMVAFNALKLAIMTNPIGLAFTALAIAGVLLWKNWDAVKGGLVAIWETIRDTAIAAFDTLKNAVGAVIDWLAAKVQWIFAVVEGIKAAANSISFTDSIGNAWSGAKSWVGLGDDATAPAAGALPAPMAAVPAGKGGSTITQSTTVQAPITINGATDPQATAKAVAAELSKREREAKASQRSNMNDQTGY